MLKWNKMISGRIFSYGQMFLKCIQYLYTFQVVMKVFTNFPAGKL